MNVLQKATLLIKIDEKMKKKVLSKENPKLVRNPYVNQNVNNKTKFKWYFLQNF